MGKFHCVMIRNAFTSYLIIFARYGPNLDMSQMVDDYSPVQQEQVEEMPISTVRLWWVRFVWLLTWWIPSVFLRWFGGMKREDVRMAWREKFVLCFLIFMFSAATLFFIAGFGEMVCPGTKSLYSVQDVANHNLLNDFYVSVRGKVYDVTRFAVTDHGTTTYASTRSAMESLAGQDLSSSFPVPLTAGCPGLVTDDLIKIRPNETAIISSFVHFSGNQQPDVHLDKMTDKNWIWDYFMPVMNLYKKGDLVIPMKTIQDDFNGWGRLIVSINNKVYDITDYMSTAKIFPSYAPTQPNYRFLDPVVETIFTKFGGTDATAEWNKFKKSMTPEKMAQNQNCLDNVFYIGRLDYRDDARCTFTNYLLLAFALVMCFVTLIKFLAALQFGGVPTPEQYDKFVICQVPCYTEDEESIRKTINSITVMEYDDKRKLIFMIADGMIMGSGNDRPTPRIVLDILGHNPKLDPEPLMFKSIGEGSKQLNYGKVYSGLYEHEGHVVPYIVVVKVGKASERSKPGNRGKRDSQIICMNFLNKVHFESEMTPLELEMYHQIKNVIGVDPSFYEYVLMIDADTEVMPDALTRMISCLLHDGKIIGICGETSLGNEDNSWTTMIQVYEYYISHHLSKAFESLFGSVTCLPGCFCMYRIRTPNKNLPLIIAPQVIQEYSENHVDTLHKKNLLHLGEDRYLTTLMMKHFPQYKMTFTPHAQCKTIAPDRWRVLLSQRRRWINSTIHNLLELVLLPELCGFCCFSMRFVVMIDLIGTLTLPSSVIYLVYLVYVVISKTGPIPLIALCMLAGIYGLQALIFIIKRQWQHIGWMIIYIFAIPIFSFFIPIYAFWHFDDFSWGNTRVVVGDKKKQIIVADDEKFDEKMIPLKKWSTYEHELWEAGSTGSKESGKTGLTAHTYRSHHTHMSQGTDYRNRLGPDNFDYYRDSVKTHKNARRSNAGGAHSPYAASYAGSDYLQKPPKAMSLHSFGGVPDHLLDPRGSTYSIPAMSNNSIHSLNGVPTDAEIVAEIRNILATANLMTVTKKQGK
jgi:chitin synthase